MEIENIPEAQWAKTLGCAITVCDREGVVLFQNDYSRRVFAKSGDMVGRSLIPCHSPRSRQIIQKMLTEGCNNVYTITKAGQRKLIFQTPWHDEDGAIAGLVELSMVLPDDMPHYDR